MRCHLTGFDDVECPYFDNPEDMCWYDNEYRCNKINEVDTFGRRLKNISNNFKK